MPFSFFRRAQVKEGLTKTRESFLTKLTSLVLENKVDEAFWNGLEETLIGADVGVETTLAVVEALRERSELDGVRETRRVEALLKEELIGILQRAGDSGAQAALESTARPYVYLIVGVNGSGKTTSIAKLAHWFKSQKKKVLLAAGDTFRAAAIDQLKIWAQRAGADFIALQQGADPGAVAFDAWKAARARGMDILIVDTAGRLQAKTNLMKELEKTGRALQKNDLNAPQETLLVIDAVTGQNALSQAREFVKILPLTGIVVAKLDGTSKGGIVFAIARELSIPIKFIGTGESLDDFAEFNAEEFVNDLFEA